MVLGVAQGSVVPALIVPDPTVPDPTVPDPTVPDLIVPGLVVPGVVAARVPEAESARAGPVGAGVVVGVGAMVGPVGAPAEFRPASSSLPGVLAGRPLAGLNNPPAVVPVARAVRLDSMAIRVPSAMLRGPVSGEELLAIRRGLAEAPFASGVEAIVPARPAFA